MLEAFRVFANDRGWLRRLREAISTGITAEAAVERVQNEARARLQRQTDPYMRERLHDLDDLANRLLHQLTGQALVAAPESLPDNAILVARSMGPAALLEYDRKRLRGLVLEDAGGTSHVAIVARALGIPTAGDVDNITNLVEQGDAIIVDGTTGEVHVRPQPNVEAAYREKARLRARRQEQYHRLRHVPAITRDGVEVNLMMNAGLMVDLQNLPEAGVRSIGLFRTELQFMLASRFPKVEKQYTLYKDVMDAVPGSVTFRTLDIGGDKILPYMKTYEEENPALGWRAIRIGLDRPGLLRLQLRALLRAGAGRELRIMFPMVTMVSEFDARESHRRARGRASAPPWPRGAARIEAGRHDRSARAALAARRTAAARRLPVRRLERSRPVPDRRRPRQSSRGEPFRCAVARPFCARSRRCRARRARSASP